MSTAAARAALPESVAHRDATFTAGRAEPYRANGAPLLAQVREEAPAGALGATISGSGPTVIVWARPEAAAACARELADRFPDVSVLSLSVSPEGAHSL